MSAGAIAKSVPEFFPVDGSTSLGVVVVVAALPVVVVELALGATAVDVVVPRASVVVLLAASVVVLRIATVVAVALAVVCGTHRGTYDLMMRSGLAACLYGGNVSDIVASVAVVYDNAASTTTEVKTDVTNDGTWFKVSASGFHYSMPTIKTTLASKSGTLPMVNSAPSIIKKSVSARALATRAQLVVSRGDVLSLQVSKARTKKCIVVRQTLRIAKTGTCRVTVRVESRKQKPRFRTMTLQVVK